MTDYTKLVKALRHCVSDEKGVTKCAGCPYYPDITGCMDRLHTDAADAIEALQAEQNKTVTQIFCEEQAAWEGRCKDLMKQIGELQAEVKILKVSGREAYFEGLAADSESKRGEWSEGNRRPRSMQFVCSVCHRTAYDPQPTRDKTWKKRCRYPYCPNCGAKMEVQE